VSLAATAVVLVLAVAEGARPGVLLARGDRARNLAGVAEAHDASTGSTLYIRYRPIGCAAKGHNATYRNGPARKVVALTFDDGPWTDTPAFVEMLAAARVPATFFLIGRQVTARYRATLRRELRDGDALGDHTWSHVALTGSVDVYAQLHDTISAIRALTGYTPCVFRPPFGDLDASVLETAGSLRLAAVLWDFDPSDYLQPGVYAIEHRVLAQIRPGAIILSHDGGGPRGQTLAAYPYIIAALRAHGYTFVTVPQLLGFATIYRACFAHCGGVGVTAPLPQGSIVDNG
jgi:peptidoglycan/xylan/chitin deacetylase (PgdA/CDA1 family)